MVELAYLLCLGTFHVLRWRLVIHGGNDGYTRIPVYLKCSSNNKADTVLQLFIEAVEEYALPSCVRSDKGGENIWVASYVLEHPNRGVGRVSMITGRSVHNQRIERLWQDLFEGVLYVYYHLFHHMESFSQLDPSNSLRLFCLHYVYIPQINRHLEIWKQGYVRYSIRTAGNRSPMQLYILGLLSQRHSSHIAVQDLYAQFEEVGTFYCVKIFDETSHS